jgi:hypothetical protein
MRWVAREETVPVRVLAAVLELVRISTRSIDKILRLSWRYGVRPLTIVPLVEIHGQGRDRRTDYLPRC